MLKNICLALFLFASQIANAEDIVANAPSEASAVRGDYRLFVPMPEKGRELIRQDMLDNLSAMNEILGYLAANNLNAAADVAESRMGRSSMGIDAGTGLGIGKLMPREMRKIGMSMRDAATEFAENAKKGDLPASYGSLQKITNTCVACHYSYRTR